jgi:predicted nucleic acid-binding protein
MVYLIDANIIIRFLAGDHKEHLAFAREILQKIEGSEIKAQIPNSVMAEIFFVMTKVYKAPKNEIIQDLKKIVAMRGMVGDKALQMELLHILEYKNIDFVDALLCAKKQLYGYDILSFDNKEALRGDSL